MDRKERSAGVVVFRLEDGGTRPYLLLDYGRYWDLAKGHVEEGEDDLTAALRELKEETGIDDANVAPGFRREIQYFFRDRKAALVHKTVIYFLAETKKSGIVISHEHVGAGFFDIEKALKQVGFDTTRQVLEATEAKLKDV